MNVAGMGAGLLRLTLLALLSVGVIGMHTVGHSGDHSSWETSSHATGATMPEAAMASAAAWLTDAINLCDGDCGTAIPVVARSGSGSDPLHGGTGLVVMCLAVLAGLGVLALLASVLARRHRSVAGTAAPCSTRSPRAGPVQAFMFASRLVDVAVLRI